MQRLRVMFAFLFIYVIFHRLLCAFRVRLSRMGVQARVEPGLQTDPAVALYPGAAQERRVPRCHRMAGGLRRVCHQRPRRGGQTVGGAQVQASDELRQTQSSSQVNLFHPNHVISLSTRVVHVKADRTHPTSKYRSINKLRLNCATRFNLMWPVQLRSGWSQLLFYIKKNCEANLFPIQI